MRTNELTRVLGEWEGYRIGVAERFEAGVKGERADAVLDFSRLRGGVCDLYDAAHRLVGDRSGIAVRLMLVGLFSGITAAAGCFGVWHDDFRRIPLARRAKMLNVLSA